MLEYKKVASKQDLKEGSLVRVELDGKPIVLAMVNGKIFAMDAVCSHEGGPLEEGKLEGYELTCPWHFAIFDVRNAKVSDKTVWATDLNSYLVQVDEATGDISLSLQGRKEEPLKQEKQQKEASQQQYYAEEERKAADAAFRLELLAKEKLEGTDIMTFKVSRKSPDGIQMNYAAGQYAFFKLDGVSDDPKGPVRHFSIASSPTEQNYLLISTRIRETPYKQKLASLENGTKILTWGPQGNFILQQDRPAVFLSGGIGVTPFRSMLKYATDKSLRTRILMFDSNRNEDNILYKEEFDSWAAENKNLEIIYTLTDEAKDGWKGERGRINKEMVTKYLSIDEIANAIFYICGPPGMLKAMQKLLQKDLQVPEERIKIEEFTGY